MNPNDLTVPAQNLVTAPKTFAYGDTVTIIGEEGVCMVMGVSGNVLHYIDANGNPGAANRLNADKVGA